MTVINILLAALAISAGCQLLLHLLRIQGYRRPTRDAAKLALPYCLAAYAAESVLSLGCTVLKPLAWIGGAVADYAPRDPAAATGTRADVAPPTCADSGTSLSRLPEENTQTSTSKLPAAQGASRPVLLLHGWGMNRICMAVLAARLRRDGRRVVAISYNSYGRDNATKSANVAARLRRLAPSIKGTAMDVVAHSLGGIIVRGLVREQLAGLCFVNIVTLGSPHRGAMLAARLPASIFGQLCPGSDYLRTLGEDSAALGCVHFTSIYSTFDAVVYPPENCELSGALNVSVNFPGHLGLLFSDRIYTLIKENLD